ncbi:MAG: hypothetical protein K0R12_764 [Gammaproteobacteria bacterium]|jgi:hyperosmotically inducible protein|nr:hypothetical protein [Gammaproteobacteria bacterium]
MMIRINKIILSILLSLFLVPLTCYGKTLVLEQALMQDAKITAQLAQAFTKSSLFNNKIVSIQSEQGNVFLVGKVDSRTAWEEAVKIAKATRGVNSVDASHLTIQSSSLPIADKLEAVKVRKEIERIDELANGSRPQFKNVRVEVNNGLLFLSGEVSTAEQKAQITRTARDVFPKMAVNADAVHVAGTHRS